MRAMPFDYDLRSGGDLVFSRETLEPSNLNLEFNATYHVQSAQSI
jgi:hypothetical protein